MQNKFNQNLNKADAQEKSKRLPREAMGRHMGDELRAMGYDFFDDDREYFIRRPDPNGVVVVDSWSSSDGPDSDGFGREEYYDWWLLDEQLRPIPGIDYWHDYSNRDMNNAQKSWDQLVARAGQILRDRA